MAETGFGTGLNFLTLWQAFDAFEQQHPDSTFKHLHYVSFEKYPLLADDLAAAHARWPELKHFSEQLCAVWPAALPGCHRVFLANGRITLDLWFGDVNELIHVLPHSLNEQIDAWFLDGFAPSKTQICGRLSCLTPWSSWQKRRHLCHLHRSRLCASRFTGGGL